MGSGNKRGGQEGRMRRGRESGNGEGYVWSDLWMEIESGGREGGWMYSTDGWW